MSDELNEHIEGIGTAADEPSEFELLRSRWRDLGHAGVQLYHRTAAIERLLIEKELLTIEEIEQREAQVAEDELLSVTAAVPSRAGKSGRTVARIVQGIGSMRCGETR
jgi:hypothetical protein